MYHRPPNVDEWKALDFTDKYAVGMVWQRFQWLMEYDPYAVLFTERTREAICVMLIGNSSGLLVKDDVLVSTDREELSAKTLRALDISPLGRMLSDEMKSHITGLLMTAIFAGQKD